MIVLLRATKIPVAGEKSVPFLTGHLGKFLLLRGGFRRLAELLEDQDKLVIQFQDPVPRIRVGSHLHTTTGRVRSGNFLPDNGPHIVKADGLAKSNDLLPDRDDFVPAVINGTRKLVADIHTQFAAIMEHTITFVPNEIQIIDVALVGFVIPDLIARPIIF